MRVSSLFILVWIVPCIASADSSIDGIEHIFGATNVNAITGHGRLTAGVSRDGDLTVLTWPSPSYSDQLAYLTSNAFEARSLPRFGAQEGEGIFLGLYVEREGGVFEVHFLRDPEVFTSVQDYGPTDGPNPTTVFTSAALGLTVTVVDAVSPSVDVLAREVRVVRESGSDVVGAHLITVANLSPVPPSSRIPQLPVVDWAYDGRNDFAAVYDESEGVVLHFHPGDERVHTVIADLLVPPDVDFGELVPLLESASPSGAEIENLVQKLDTAFSAGVTIAMTTVPRPDQHQIGFDRTPTCATVDEIADNIIAAGDGLKGAALGLPTDIIDLLRCGDEAIPLREREGWMYDAEDAYLDARDGQLSMSSLAAGEVNEALRTPLTFVAGDDGTATAEASVLFGAGSLPTEARANVLAVTAPFEIAAAAEAALESFLADVTLPSRQSERVNRVARRSLINLRVGTDASTGAIVASISRQPPYGLDWPRDGAYFNLVLDASGQTDVVTRRGALYDAWQRKSAVSPVPILDIAPPANPDGSSRSTYPEGGFEMNYYPDGMIGGIFRFEIDNTGFALFALCAHAGYLEEAERSSYLARHWDAIVLAADHLAEWRDPDTKLHAPAQEDDNAAYVSTLHGAVTTFGALDVASRAARLIGEDAAASRWERRARELRGAIERLLYDEELGHFVRRVDPDDPGLTPTGQTAWLVYPMTLLPLDDPRIEAQVRRDLELIGPRVAGETEGSVYVMKNTLAAAMAAPHFSESSATLVRETVGAMLESLAQQSTAGTHHFGEVMVISDPQGERTPSQRVATPHLWEGALFYLSALALEDPLVLARHEEVLPPSRSRTTPSAQGGCASTSTSTSALLVLLLSLALVGRVRSDGRSRR